MNNCDRCERELKENEEVFEVGYQFVCMSCLDDLNSKYETLYEGER